MTLFSRLFRRPDRPKLNCAYYVGKNDSFAFFENPVTGTLVKVLTLDTPSESAILKVARRWAKANAFDLTLRNINREPKA